jgi:hypothetical protein
MAPTIGICLVMVGEYTIMQSIFLYLPFTYPQYAASLFAANDFARSFFAAGCIVFSGPMFKSLGVAKGVTLLGGLTVGCTAGLLVLYFYGAELRKRSNLLLSDRGPVRARENVRNGLGYRIGLDLEYWSIWHCIFKYDFA